MTWERSVQEIQTGEQRSRPGADGVLTGQSLATVPEAIWGLEDPSA